MSPIKKIFLPAFKQREATPLDWELRRKPPNQIRGEPKPVNREKQFHIPVDPTIKEKWDHLLEGENYEPRVISQTLAKGDPEPKPGPGSVCAAAEAVAAASVTSAAVAAVRAEAKAAALASVVAAVQSGAVACANSFANGKGKIA